MAQKDCERDRWRDWVPCIPKPKWPIFRDLFQIGKSCDLKSLEIKNGPFYSMKFMPWILSMGHSVWTQAIWNHVIVTRKMAHFRKGNINRPFCIALNFLPEKLPGSLITESSECITCFDIAFWGWVNSGLGLNEVGVKVRRVKKEEIKIIKSTWDNPRIITQPALFLIHHGKLWRHFWTFSWFFSNL